MRRKDPELMEKIKVFAEDCYEEHRENPSNRAIADAMGIGRSTVYYYLVEIANRHMSSYEDGVITSAKIEKFMQLVRHAAVVGSIHCGEPDEREAMVQEYISLPVSVFGDGDFYILRASGDSMIGTGIDSGDLVIIQKQETANSGDIVVALTGKNQNSLKRLLYDDDCECYYLHPENPDCDDIYVDNLSVRGVARHVIKAP